MFTGIVEGIGTVREADRGAVLSLWLEAGFDLGGAAPGDSIAVSGTCLTIVELRGRAFRADVTAETIQRTTLGTLRPGRCVNLERPVVIGGRLGGHLVQGHVDGTGRIVTRRPDGDARWLEVEAPASIAQYAVEKGSIAVDGVSLTVGRVRANRFAVCLLPHTLRLTTMGSLEPGDAVNLEADIVAKYVERLLGPHAGGAAAAAETEAGSVRNRGREGGVS